MDTPDPTADGREHAEAEIEFPPTLSNSELLDAGKELIAHAREQLIESNRKSSSRAAIHRYSKFFDNLIRALHNHVTQKWEAEGRPLPESLAIAALGGYGRREQCLYSDVDLLFLMGEREKPPQDFIKALLHPLYDWGLEVGHSVRRLEDCTATIGIDLESVTGMMEARYVAGSRPLFQHFHEFFYRALRAGGRRWFLQNRLREWQERQEKYDASVYLLEPNLKESKGGLRDIHGVRWILLFQKGAGELSQLEDLGILTAAELRRLRQAEEFILTLRNELHALNPRKSDLLNFESQIEITRRLGYEGTETLLAEEALMRDYYRHARAVAKYTSRALSCTLRSEKSTLGAFFGSLKRRRLDKHHLVQDHAIFIDDKFPKYLEQDPVRIMALFARGRKIGARVSERTRDSIEKIAPGIGEEFQESPEASKLFMEIVEGPERVARTLSDMHDCGFLSAYIPEFEHVHCMVRMDHYHRYTVDEHLIKAVEYSERLFDEPKEKRSHAATIAHEIKRRDLLNLSLLLHDIGKGFGKGHALRGGQLIQRIGQRMGLDPEDVETLRFLVLSHLKISHVSGRRDLDDPAVAWQLAKEIGDLDRLKLLYVHSVCDLKAVSPDAMTEWKAQLYEACYRVTAAALDESLARQEGPSSTAESIRDRVWEAFENHESHPVKKDAKEHLRHKLEEFLESVPSRYLQTTHPQYVAEHFRLLQMLDDKTRIEWSLDNGAGLTELTICSADMPGTFAMTCGALAAKDINIWSAQIFSTLDGYAINRFQVTDLENKPLPHGFRLERLRADLNQVLLGKKSIPELLEKYHGHSIKKRPPLSRRPSEIWIDNDASKQFSVLEIRTADRPGLLFQIATVLDAHKLNIYRAMLATEAYGVSDVFYLTDLEFNKLLDEAQIERLINDLKKAIDVEAGSSLQPAGAGAGRSEMAGDPVAEPASNPG